MLGFQLIDNSIRSIGAAEQQLEQIIVLLGMMKPLGKRSDVVEDRCEELEVRLDAVFPHILEENPQDVEYGRKTLVLALPIEEGSAKVRTGPPVDDDEDYDLDVWAGVVPLRLTASPAIPDPALREGIPQPAYVA